MAINNPSYPPLWIGVRDKAQYKFRNFTADIIKTANFFNELKPGYVGIEVTGLTLSVGIGDWIKITICPDNTDYIGTHRVVEVIQQGSETIAFINLSPSGPEYIGCTFDLYYGRGMSVKVFASDPDTQVPDRDALPELVEITGIYPHPLTMYYTVNVAEFLKARIDPNPEHITEGTLHLYTPYYLQYYLDDTWVGGFLSNDGSYGDYVNYALDSMLTDLTPYSSLEVTQLLLSPFSNPDDGNVLPVWPGFDTVISYIKHVSGGESQLLSEWLSDTEAEGLVEIPIVEGAYLSIEFIPMPCPKFPAVQVIWRNPQGGWSYWVFAYNNEESDDISEDEPYVNTLSETVSQGVVALKKMQLYSGFISRESFARGLKTLRYSEHVYVREYLKTTEVPSFKRVRVTTGSFFFGKVEDKRWEVNCEITYSLPEAT